MEVVILFLMLVILSQWIFIHYGLAGFSIPFGQHNRKTNGTIPSSNHQSSNGVSNPRDNGTIAGARPRRAGHQVRRVPRNMQQMQNARRTAALRSRRPLPAQPSAGPPRVTLPSFFWPTETGSTGYIDDIVSGGSGIRTNINLDYGSHLDNWRQPPGHPSNRPRNGPPQSSDEEFVLASRPMDQEDASPDREGNAEYSHRSLCDGTARIGPIPERVERSNEHNADQPPPYVLDEQTLDQEATGPTNPITEQTTRTGDTTITTTFVGAIGISGPDREPPANTGDPCPNNREE